MPCRSLQPPCHSQQVVGGMAPRLGVMPPIPPTPGTPLRLRRRIDPGPALAQAWTLASAPPPARLNRLWRLRLAAPQDGAGARRWPPHRRSILRQRHPRWKLPSSHWSHLTLTRDLIRQGTIRRTAPLRPTPRHRQSRPTLSRPTPCCPPSGTATLASGRSSRRGQMSMNTPCRPAPSSCGRGRRRSASPAPRRAGPMVASTTGSLCASFNPGRRTLTRG